MRFGGSQTKDSFEPSDTRGIHRAFLDHLDPVRQVRSDAERQALARTGGVAQRKASCC